MGIWAGGWGVAASVSRPVPWHGTAIRAYRTVHPQALYTAASPGVAACSDADDGWSEAQPIAWRPPQRLPAAGAQIGAGPDLLRAVDGDQGPGHADTMCKIGLRAPGISLNYAHIRLAEPVGDPTGEGDVDRLRAGPMRPARRGHSFRSSSHTLVRLPASLMATDLAVGGTREMIEAKEEDGPRETSLTRRRLRHHATAIVVAGRVHCIRARRLLALVPRRVGPSSVKGTRRSFQNRFAACFQPSHLNRSRNGISQSTGTCITGPITSRFGGVSRVSIIGPMRFVITASVLAPNHCWLVSSRYLVCHR